MPEISRFLGIIIRMYRDEHPPPRFHAIYGEFSAQISIRSPGILRGKLPPRVLGFVTEWAALHEAELERNWRASQTDGRIEKIAPLI
jgi:hypothetical protein